MVKITNGIDVFEVTRGAFNDIYSHQGFYETNKVEKIEEAEIHVAEDKTADDLFCENLLEKPIAQWNKDEVKNFCAIKSIDISGTKNANEAKDLVKKYLEENE